MTKRKRLFCIFLAISVAFPLFIGSWAGAFSRKTPVVRAAETVSPAVVNIGTEYRIRDRQAPFSLFGDPIFDSFFRDFFESVPREQRKKTSLGSGVIIDGDKGFVLTNAHVIERADTISVILKDEREFAAEIVGADPATDLAVLRIQSEQRLPEVGMGDSDDLMIGESVIAIGNPFGFSHTVTTGVVSALHRSIRAEDRIYHDFIQTDASINPGNSGGPLLNINGELIGINTAIYAKAQGIGFAIPINKARTIVADLVAHGEVTRGWLGLSVQALDPRMARYLGYSKRQGLLIQAVAGQSPAARAGLRNGDILLELGGTELYSVRDYELAVRDYTPGSQVRLKIWREGEAKKLSLTAAPFPMDQAPSLAMELLGVQVRDARAGEGVEITELHSRSYLANIGAQPGDRIRKINDTPIRNTEDFYQAMVKFRHKKAVAVLLQRGNQGYYVNVPL